MFALLAIVCFFLKLIGANLGVDLVVLGLLFLGCALLWGWSPFNGVTWNRRQ